MNFGIIGAGNIAAIHAQAIAAMAYGTATVPKVDKIFGPGNQYVTVAKQLVSKEGIKRLGAGAFSQVFQHPHYGNVVVKVYKNKDTAYRKYVTWCMAHQSNPYVPKIVDQVSYKSLKTKEKYHIVFLQKMTPVRTAGKLALLLAKALDLDPKDDAEFFAEFGQYNTSKQDFRMIEKYIALGRADKDFEEIWDHIRTYGPAKFDLHSGNVMLRDGHLVITDPVANNHTSRLDRFEI